MGCSACLVTSTPSFEKPEQTPPFLVAADAKPDLRQPIVVADLSEQPALTFNATVISEDRDKVGVRLLVDYGFVNQAGQKARWVIYGHPIDAGSIGDAPRPVTATWYPGANPVERGGCHTVTMIVSHAFDDSDNGCPVRLCDSSSLTWQVILPCAPGDTCPTICDPAPDTCPVEGEGASAELSCPGDAAALTTGGAP